jgi:hypothetical protein
VDFGCAECKFVKLLKRLPFVREIVGVDVDKELLLRLEEEFLVVWLVGWMFVTRNFRILHPIINDAETDRFGSLLLCQEQGIAIINYSRVRERIFARIFFC